MAQAAPPRRSDRLVQQKLWEAAFDRLHADIVSGALAPGTKLIEADLAERFGVSRGPIREALRELVRRGLAVDRPRQGTSVSTLTESDLDEVFLIREALEVAAGLLAVVKARPEEIADLRSMAKAIDAAYAMGDSERGLGLDLDFHRRLFSLSGSARLLAMFDQLAGQTLVLLGANHQTFGQQPRPPRGAHRKIVDAIAQRSEEALDRAVKEHYRYQGDRLFPVRDPS
jgi:DNA-binding GntR family transcriptional regulator